MTYHCFKYIFFFFLKALYVPFITIIKRLTNTRMLNNKHANLTLASGNTATCKIEQLVAIIIHKTIYFYAMDNQFGRQCHRVRISHLKQMQRIVKHHQLNFTRTPLLLINLENGTLERMNFA